MKASVHACFAFNSLSGVQLFTFQFIYFGYVLSNKLSKVKIVSVLNYTKINHYTITLLQVFWNSAKLKSLQISKLCIKETQIQNIYQRSKIFMVL